MIDYKRVQEFIERRNVVKLTPTQVQILKAIIRGDVIYTARGIGRSMLYHGYADYLKSVVSMDTDRTITSPEGFDSIFTIETFKNDIASSHWFYDEDEDINYEWFNKEFMCKFVD